MTDANQCNMWQLILSQYIHVTNQPINQHQLPVNCESQYLHSSKTTPATTTNFVLYAVNWRMLYKK